MYYGTFTGLKGISIRIRVFANPQEKIIDEA